jgi:hypothetical protein
MTQSTDEEVKIPWKSVVNPPDQDQGQDDVHADGNEEDLAFQGSRRAINVDNVDMIFGKGRQKV